MTRRKFLAPAGAAAGAVAAAANQSFGAPAPAIHNRDRTDAVVVGAGVFGAWTAWHLQRMGKRVTLVDAYGPAHSRASSGGESRVIRMGYGPDEIYTRMSMRSLELWRELSARTGDTLFHPTGVLWMGNAADASSASTLETLGKVGVVHERLDGPALRRRFPQMNVDGISWAIFEPESGALLARRAVQAVVRAAVSAGVDYQAALVSVPDGTGRLERAPTAGGKPLEADVFVFACGPWLPKVFPAVLGERIFPTRQEVFYFGAPAGDARFAPPAMPVWIDNAQEIYGLPDLEGRGFKVAPDRHGAAFDPDRGERLVTRETLEVVQRYVASRFPPLASAPLIASEVCQYENTSNGDFLIDRHPERPNVWLVGGGSGHGFKHGPAVGEYVATRVVEGGEVDPRFSLATKARVQKRTVF